MRHYDTVLFDLDGTLIDSIDLIIDSYLHTFRTHGATEPTREEILAGIGTPLRTIFAPFTTDPAMMDAWVATYREYNLGHHDTRVRAYPGTVEMVNSDLEASPERVNEDWWGRGWMVVIRADEPQAVDALMDATGYAEHIASLDH